MAVQCTECKMSKYEFTHSVIFYFRKKTERGRGGRKTIPNGVSPFFVLASRSAPFSTSISKISCCKIKLRLLIDLNKNAGYATVHFCPHHFPILLKIKDTEHIGFVKILNSWFGSKIFKKCNTSSDALQCLKRKRNRKNTAFNNNINKKFRPEPNRKQHVLVAKTHCLQYPQPHGCLTEIQRPQHSHLQLLCVA